MMSAGEAVGTTVFAWAQEALGVTINEMFGQTEMNYIVGNSHTLWPAKPGSMGRPYPGHRIAVLDEDGQPVGRGRDGRSGGQPRRARRRARPGLLSRVLQESRRHGEEIQRRLVPHRRPGRRRTRTATSGTRAARTTCSRRQAIGSARPRSRIAWCGILRWPTPRSCPVPTRRAGNVVKAYHRARAGTRSLARARGRDPAPRAGASRAVRVPEGDRIHRRPADDDDRQGAAAACSGSASSSARRTRPAALKARSATTGLAASGRRAAGERPRASGGASAPRRRRAPPSAGSACRTDRRTRSPRVARR